MKINRPLSPHLSIYRPQLTSILSIFHRISGGFLASILLSTIFCLKICNLSLSYYQIYWCFFYIATNLDWFLFSIINLVLLAICFHVTNGIRHILWDLGFFLDLPKVYRTGAFTIIFSLILFTILNNFARII